MRRKILDKYESLHKDNPSAFYGACKISKLLKIPKEDCGWKYFGIHGVLLELKAEGFLEQRYKRGFRYNI